MLCGGRAFAGLGRTSAPILSSTRRSYLFRGSGCRLTKVPRLLRSEPFHLAHRFATESLFERCRVNANRTTTVRCPETPSRSDICGCTGLWSAAIARTPSPGVALRYHHSPETLFESVLNVVAPISGSTGACLASCCCSRVAILSPLQGPRTSGAPQERTPDGCGRAMGDGMRASRVQKLVVVRQKKVRQFSGG